MARTRVRFGRLGALVAAVLVAANLVAQAASGEPPARAEPAPTVHAVRSGETLWGIARDLVGPEGDPRPVVAEIRELNGVGELRAGTTLILPAA